MSLVCTLPLEPVGGFDQTCTETPLRHEKDMIRFCDIDLIFKVTPALWMSSFAIKRLYAPFVLNQMMDSGQTLCIVSLG